MNVSNNKGATPPHRRGGKATAHSAAVAHAGANATAVSKFGHNALNHALHHGHTKAALPLALASARTTATLRPPLSSPRRTARRRRARRRRTRASTTPPAGRATTTATRARRRWRAAATPGVQGGMTVKEINAAFGERRRAEEAGEAVGLIDTGLIHLFMM